MEIIVKSNKFYFRAMLSIDLESPSRNDNPTLDKLDSKGDQDALDDDNPDSIEPSKAKPLFAWFSSELSSRLPTPAVSVINGNKRYYCTKCNHQMFIYPNPAILHILFACTATSASSLNTSSSNERLASPSGRPDNNTSLSLGNNNHLDNSVHKSSISSSPINSTSISGVANSTPSNSIDTSYTPLNGSLSLANSKILKNLEAKLCKQFSAHSSGAQQPSISTDSTLNLSNHSSSTSSSTKSNSNQKASKPSKKRAFDIDSLVNNIDQPTAQSSNKRQRCNDSSKASRNSESAKLFKTPLSTASSSTKTNDSLTNSTLINTLNGPLATNELASSAFINPFSLLDPASLATSLPSAFHKVDNSASSSKSSLLNSSNLTAAEHASLLNAAMFGATNFANPFDLATIYAHHQRNLLQSMFNQSQSANQLSSGSSGLNYIQNQLTNPLFAPPNLANLSVLNSLNDFNGLSNLLVNQPNLSSNLSSNLGSNSHLSSNLTPDLTGIPPSLANSLFGLTGQMNQPSATNQSFNSLDQFAVPQISEKTQPTKKKKSKDKDLNNNSHAKQSSQANSSSSTNNRNALNDASKLSSLSSLIPPSYLQFLPPSLAALSHPQSNWCAKCNISFRMTSDLVYHMRSAHKETNLNGSTDGGQCSSSPKRKKDENKLFCSICGESFKERHHLSRHLVSH